jgi:hypothetical protein
MSCNPVLILFGSSRWCIRNKCLLIDFVLALRSRASKALQGVLFFFIIAVHWTFSNFGSGVKYFHTHKFWVDCEAEASGVFCCILLISGVDSDLVGGSLAGRGRFLDILYGGFAVLGDQS